MMQQDLKYLAFCYSYDDEDYVFRASTIDGLMDEIDDWYEETQGETA